MRCSPEDVRAGDLLVRIVDILVHNDGSTTDTHSYAVYALVIGKHHPIGSTVINITCLGPWIKNVMCTHGTTFTQRGTLSTVCDVERLT